MFSLAAAARRVANRSLMQEATILARAWTKYGFPGRSEAGAQATLDAVVGHPVDMFSDEAADVGAHLADVGNALYKHELLPAPRGVRLLHSIVRGDGDAVIDAILHHGLVAQPSTTGRYSESPGSVFFVVEDPGRRDRGRYSDEAPFVVVDVPKDWPGWRGSIGRGRLENPIPDAGDVVAFQVPVPASFVVGVNGLPVHEYKAGARYKFGFQVPRSRPPA